MIIRQGTQADADEVVQLIYLAIKDIAYQLTGEQEQEKMLAQLRAFYVSEGNRFSHPLVTVAEEDKQVVAMILCYDGKEANELYLPIIQHLEQHPLVVDSSVDVEADEDEYYIDALAVTPAMQKKGIAKLLFEAAEKETKSRGIKHIALNVDKDNGQALALYKRLGYVANKEITINKRPYYHMVKRLEP